ncbi:hypothetical protein HDU97_002986 [Phlyctochytrium planicorne]|nr:hypothetical protein HDU97_002986 [Phlyctochytrium planicorne]
MSPEARSSLPFHISYLSLVLNKDGTISAIGTGGFYFEFQVQLLDRIGEKEVRGEPVHHEFAIDFGGGEGAEGEDDGDGEDDDGADGDDGDEGEIEMDGDDNDEDDVEDEGSDGEEVILGGEEDPYYSTSEDEHDGSDAEAEDEDEHDIPWAPFDLEQHRQAEQAYWKSLKTVWHVIPQLDFSSPSNKYQNEQQIDCVDDNEQVSTYIMHSVCYGLLKKALDQHEISTKTLTSALDGALDGIYPFQISLKANGKRHVPPHDRLIRKACKQGFEARMDRLWSLSRPDAIATSREQIGQPFGVDPSSITTEELFEKPSKPHISFLSRPHSLVWRQCIQNSYWFLHELFSKTSNFVPLPAAPRPIQDPNVILLPTEFTRTYVLEQAVLWFLSPFDIMNLESTCLNLRRHRNQLWRVICKRDGVAAVPGEEASLWKVQADGKDLDYKALYLCGNSRNRRRIDNVIRWVVETLKVAEERLED